MTMQKQCSIQRSPSMSSSDLISAESCSRWAPESPRPPPSAMKEWARMDTIPRRPPDPLASSASLKFRTGNSHGVSGVAMVSSPESLSPISPNHQHHQASDPPSIGRETKQRLTDDSQGFIEAATLSSPAPAMTVCRKDSRRRKETTITPTRKSFDSETVPRERRRRRIRGDGLKSKDDAVMVSVKRTDSKHMKPKLGFPSPEHGLKDDPHPCIPHPSTWTHGKRCGVYVQQVVTAFNDNPKLPPVLNSSHIPLSTPIAIDNALFKGVAMIRIRGQCPSLDDVYFSGKRRKHQLVIQGTFKRRYRADEVWGGQIFRHAWINMPSGWMVRAGLSTAKMVNPSMSERLTSNRNPFVLFPWISMPQRVHITPVGQTPPSIHDPDGIPEDCSLLGPSFKNKEGFFRRKYFTDYHKLKTVYYEKDLIFTFEDYQDALDFNTFDFNLKLSTLDIALRLHDMPLEMGVMNFRPSDLNKKKLVEDEFEDLDSVPYFWRFQLWPKHCVVNRYHNGNTDEPTTAAKSASFALKRRKK